MSELDDRKAPAGPLHGTVPSADDHFHDMLLTVVDKRDRGAGLLVAIDDHADRLGNIRSSTLHGDMEEGVTMAVVNGERIPGAW